MRFLAIVAALGLVVGCASADDNAVDEPTDEATTTNGAESDAHVDEENVPEELTDPASIAESYGFDPISPGESAIYEWSYSDVPEQTQETKAAVSEYECDLPVIPEGTSNPEWDGGDTYPQHIDAPAESGKTFCTFTMSYENVGNFPHNPLEPGGVLIGPEQHDPNEADHDISWTIQDYTHEVNPGEAWQYTHVVSVPEGTSPDALLYPVETFDGGPSIAFLLD